MSEPVARLAAPDEYDRVRHVLREAFPDNPKARPEVMEWQYLQNPYGPPRTWVLEEAGEIIAVYTAIPVRIHLEGRTTTAALGIDAAVLPEHQGRRLFTPLSRALYADVAEQGWTYTLAYPSLASRNGIARAGWVEAARLRVNVLPLDDDWVRTRFGVPAPAAALLRKTAFHVGRGHTGQEVSGPSPQLDQLWGRLSTSNGIVRDGTWWQWRYRDNPDPDAYRYHDVHRDGELVASAVTATRQAFGGEFVYVLEYVAVSAADARALTRTLQASAEGAHGLAMITYGGSRLDRLSRWSGFRRLPRRLEPHPQWFGGVAAGSGAPSPDTLDWSVSWGDLDHL